MYLKKTPRVRVVFIFKLTFDLQRWQAKSSVSLGYSENRFSSPV